MGPDEALVAEIVAKAVGAGRFSFGSGYVVGPGLVLTAHHVVRNAASAGDVEVRTLGALDGWRRVDEELWSDPDLDVALLRCGNLAGTAPRCGRVPRGAAAACLAAGFPAAVALGATREVDAVEGWVKPFSGHKEGLLHIEVCGARPLSAAGWTGVSGAALFSGGLLIGVILRAPRSFGGGRLKAVAIERFSRALAAKGMQIPDVLPEVPLPDRAGVAFRSAFDVADAVAAVFQVAGRFVVARDAERAELGRHVAGEAAEPLLVSGAAGRGKSALLARWLDDHSEGCAVAAHAFSVARGLTSVADAHRHLLAQIRREGSGVVALPGERTPGPREFQAELYAAVRDWPQTSDRPLVIVVDALDGPRAASRPHGRSRWPSEYG